jgi:predicted dehydrogenase
MTVPLRVGVIGVGGIASAQHLPHWHSCPHAEIVALADTNAEVLAKIADHYGVKRTFQDWRELVDCADIDVVDVATPNRFHAPMTLAALQAGKHVLCEKPIAVNAAEAQQMVDLSQKVGRLLMVNHVFRFSRSLQQLLALTSGGRLGNVYYLRAHWNRRRMVPPRPTFIKRELAAGGPLLDIGVHMIDLAAWILGFPKVERVSGVVGKFLADQPHLSGEWGEWDPREYDVEDFAAAMVHFEGGATLSLEVSWLLFQEAPETRSLHVFGSKGGLHWPSGVFCSEQNKVPYDLKLHSNPEKESSFREAIHAFADAIVADRPSPIPPQQNVEVMRIIDALYEASSQKREVVL